MEIVLCATRAVYPQLKTMMLMLHETQPQLHIYAIIEDNELEDLDYVTYINIKNYPKVYKNRANSEVPWTYMCFARCYLPEILPDVSKVLYLDLDLWIEQDISELWNIDITNYAIAAAVDVNVRKFYLPYIPNINVYINSGVLLMNLDYMREHNMVEQFHKLLNTWKLAFPDQDVLNRVCYGAVKYLSHKWNSGVLCGEHPSPMITHHSTIKPWDIKNPIFRKWVELYLRANPQT